MWRLLPSFGTLAFRTFGSALFDDGLVTQAMFAGLPLSLLTVQLATVKFTTGDIVRYVGNPFLDDRVP